MAVKLACPDVVHDREVIAASDDRLHLGIATGAVTARDERQPIGPQVIAVEVGSAVGVGVDELLAGEEGHA